jgi:uncharacterized membrane protein YeaQ/YmgE (transglycosylase-associated protein family)
VIEPSARPYSQYEAPSSPTVHTETSGSCTTAGVSLETFLLWTAVGLIAGWLASAVVGDGYGLVGDIVIGVVGAFVGGYLFRALHVVSPFAGLAGRIFVAFVGALVLLLALRLLHRLTR